MQKVFNWRRALLRWLLKGTALGAVADQVYAHEERLLALARQADLKATGDRVVAIELARKAHEQSITITNLVRRVESINRGLQDFSRRIEGEIADLKARVDRGPAAHFLARFDQIERRLDALFRGADELTRVKADLLTAMSQRVEGDAALKKEIEFLKTELRISAECRAALFATVGKQINDLRQTCDDLSARLKLKP